MERVTATDTCLWFEDMDGNWQTGCGHIFVLEMGTPLDNEMLWCCYCGKKLEEMK